MSYSCVLMMMIRDFFFFFFFWCSQVLGLVFVLLDNNAKYLSIFSIFILFFFLGFFYSEKK